MKATRGNKHDHPFWGAAAELVGRRKLVISGEPPHDGQLEGPDGLTVKVTFDQAGKPNVVTDGAGLFEEREFIHQLLSVYSEYRAVTDEFEGLDDTGVKALYAESERRFKAKKRGDLAEARAIARRNSLLGYASQARRHHHQKASRAQAFSEKIRLPLGTAEVLEGMGERFERPSATLVAFAPQARSEAVAMWEKANGGGQSERWAVLTDLSYWEWVKEKRGSGHSAVSIAMRQRSRRRRPSQRGGRVDKDSIIPLLESRVGGRPFGADPEPAPRGDAVVVVFEGKLGSLPELLRHAGPNVHFDHHEAGALWTRWFEFYGARPLSISANLMEFQLPVRLSDKAVEQATHEHHQYGAVFVEGTRWRFRW